MRRLMLVICLAITFGSAGCVTMLDEFRRDDGHITKLGGSAKARSIENDVNWGTSF